MKECPFCGGKIQDTAIKCKYYREMLEEKSMEVVGIPCPPMKKESVNNGTVARGKTFPWYATRAVAVLLAVAAIAWLDASKGQREIFQDYRSSLWGGPGPEIVSGFLERQFPGSSTEVNKWKIINEYKRKISGETFYFFEFSRDYSNNPNHLECSFSLVKRGKNWYRYNGTQ